MNRKARKALLPFFMFLTLVIALAGQLVPTYETKANTIEAVGLTASDAKVTKDGKEVTTDTDAYQSYTVTYNWSIPDAVTVKNGDTINFELPNNVQVNGQLGINVVIKNNAGYEIGNATINPGTSQGVITITNANNLKRFRRSGVLTLDVSGTNITP